MIGGGGMGTTTLLGKEMLDTISQASDKRVLVLTTQCQWN